MLKVFVSGIVKQTPTEPKLPADNKFDSGQKIFLIFYFTWKHWRVRKRRQILEGGAEIWNKGIAILQLVPWEQAMVSTKWELKLQNRTLSLSAFRIRGQSSGQP